MFSVSATKKVYFSQGNLVATIDATGAPTAWKFATNQYGKPCYTIAKSGITIGETSYKGLFLYPDNYNGAEVSESMTWDEINAAGIVFIPAANSRESKRVSTTRHGIWSSTTDPGDDVESACKFYITDRVEVEVYDLRHYGFPVRLVADVE